MAALKQPTIRVVAIIAEGVPESDTKQLIAYARANNKVEVEIYIDQINSYKIAWKDLFNFSWFARLLLVQLPLEAFKLVLLKLVTQLEQLTI